MKNNNNNNNIKKENIIIKVKKWLNNYNYSCRIDAFFTIYLKLFYDDLKNINSLNLLAAGALHLNIKIKLIDPFPSKLK